MGNETPTCGDEDHLILILARLPVVSLLRFKSVCKSWLALIQTSFFINLHTSTTFNSSSSSNFGSFILHAGVQKRSSSRTHGYKILRENAIFMLSSGSVSESGSESVSEFDKPGGWCVSTGTDDQQVFKLDNLGIPSCYKSSVSPRVIGSCNGLICLVDSQQQERTFDEDEEEQNMDFSLWNPATRQFRILPKSIPINIDPHNSLVAFGFDVETKDYKVVLLAGGLKPKRWGEEGPMECLCRVQVYSLSTDSWRILEGINSLPGFPFFDTFEGLYLNGSCIFIARFLQSEQQMRFPKNNRFVISFDLTKEIITTIQLPDHTDQQKLFLSCLDDKMALFSVYGNENYDREDFQIWVLNEHGGSGSSVNKESWTKLHSFHMKCRVQGEMNIPKGISNDGEFALIETQGRPGSSNKMKLYNLVTKEVRKDFLWCHGVMSKAANVYKPSLVSIIGGNEHSSSSG